VRSEREGRGGGGGAARRVRGVVAAAAAALHPARARARASRPFPAPDPGSDASHLHLERGPVARACGGQGRRGERRRAERLRKRGEGAVTRGSTRGEEGWLSLFSRVRFFQSPGRPLDAKDAPDRPGADAAHDARRAARAPEARCMAWAAGDLFGWRSRLKARWGECCPFGLALLRGSKRRSARGREDAGGCAVDVWRCLRGRKAVRWATWVWGEEATVVARRGLCATAGGGGRWRAVAGREALEERRTLNRTRPRHSCDPHPFSPRLLPFCYSAGPDSRAFFFRARPSLPPQSKKTTTSRSEKAIGA
jgi:hypothetical protein